MKMIDGLGICYMKRHWKLWLSSLEKRWLRGI